MFGSSVKRFQSVQSDETPGPGQYQVSQNRKNLLQTVGTQNFKSPARKEAFADLIHNYPAPGDYLTEA